MKNFKTVLVLVLAFCLIVSGLSACGGETSTTTTGAAGESATAAPTKKDAIVMRIGHGSAAGSARDQACEAMAAYIEEKSEGRIDCQVYPASQLGSVMELIQGIQTNTIECTVQPISQTSGFQPLCTVMDIPYFLPSNYDDLTAVLNGPGGDALNSAMEEVGIKNLGYWYSGFKVFTANSPLEKPSDFKGLKCRAMSSSILMAQYSVVGATPVYIDFSETYNALSTGAIDGQDNPFDTTTDMNFQEVQKYCVVSNHGNLELGCMVSKQWFESLSAEDQTIIMEGVAVGEEVCHEVTVKNNENGRKKMEEANMTIKDLTDEEMEEWKKAFEPVVDVYLKDNGEKGQAIIDLFREEMAKLH